MRSFAKLSIKAGMNLIYIQSLMGHSDIETTRNYVQKLDNSEVLNAQKIQEQWIIIFNYNPTAVQNPRIKPRTTPKTMSVAIVRTDFLISDNISV